MTFASSLFILASTAPETAGLAGEVSCLGPAVTFSIAGAVVIGLGVGFLSGLLGVGGGFLLAPLLNGFLGIPLSVAAPSDLCQIQGTSLAGLLRHRKHGKFDPRVAVVVLGGTFCGTAVGVEIIKYLKAQGSFSLSGGAYPKAEVVLAFLFLAILVVIGTCVSLESIRAGRRAKDGTDQKTGPRAGLFSRIKLPPYITPVGGKPVSAILVAYSGLVVGVLQAMLGIGGGVLLLPILIYLVGVSTHAAVGTSLMIVLVSSVWGTLLHSLDGNISLPLVGALLVSSTFGSQIGALTSRKVAGHKLRKYFALVIAAAVLVIGGTLCQMYGLISWWPGGAEGG